MLYKNKLKIRVFVIVFLIFDLIRPNPMFQVSAEKTGQIKIVVDIKPIINFFTVISRLIWAVLEWKKRIWILIKSLIKKIQKRRETLYRMIVDKLNLKYENKKMILYKILIISYASDHIIVHTENIIKYKFLPSEKKKIFYPKIPLISFLFFIRYIYGIFIP